jgi:hypothetical protein
MTWGTGPLQHCCRWRSLARASVGYASAHGGLPSRQTMFCAAAVQQTMFCVAGTAAARYAANVLGICLQFRHLVRPPSGGGHVRAYTPLATLATLYIST